MRAHLSYRCFVSAPLLCVLQRWTGLKLVLVQVKATRMFRVFLLAPPLGRQLGRRLVHEAIQELVRDEA